MMLEFAWIEDWGVIKKQGFNFNPNVFYSFDNETGEISKEIFNEIPIDFFNLNNDTVTGISALVGANGTGKSTVLLFINSFLTYHRPLGGFVIINGQIINKSDFEISFSRDWFGKKIPILNRRDLINYYRKESGYKLLNKNSETKNDILGLRILDNLIEDTRIIYYAGETNLEHTNRVYQSLLSLTDAYENSHYSDISDIAMISRDQESKRSNKAVYSGENPILTYRSGESQRFLNLMLSDYKELIPFSIAHLEVGVTFNDIDKTFFESYDEIAFGAIMSLLKNNLKSKSSKMSSELIEDIEEKGLGGYFDSKLNALEKKNSEENLEIHYYHRLLLRHIREQIMETMGELTEKDKLGNFISLLTEIEKYFTTTKTYLHQIKDYLSKTKFAIQFTGKLNLKIVEDFYIVIKKLELWEYEKFAISLSSSESINTILNSINKLDNESGLRYKLASIFDLDLRGLSTGEKQFLKVFSRFVTYNLNNKRNNLNEKNFIILLDEFEIGFHPLWQRKFLNVWITFLEKFINQLPDNRIKVQIILTSHSPFVVSDLPKQCINFLSKKEGDKTSKVDRLNQHYDTFGSNIHELFSDSFFLDGALMGDFAKQKIDKIFEDLLNKSTIDNSYNINSIIKLIGEPIIRTKLAEMYAERKGENVEIARLKAQQEYINQRLKEIEKNDSN